MYRLFLILNLDYFEAKIVYHWIKNKQCYLKNKKTDASYFLPRSITEPFFVNDQRLKIDSMLLCVLCGEKHEKDLDVSLETSKSFPLNS